MNEPPGTGVRVLLPARSFRSTAMPDGFYVGLAERSASAAVPSGPVRDADAAEWLAGFRAQLARGPVVAGRLHVFA